MIYYIYSDYSRTEIQASYAFVIVQKDNNGIWDIYKSGSRKLKIAHQTHIGEAMGCMAGIRMVPDDSNVVVHIDMIDVISLLESNKKKPSFHRLRKELKIQRNRLKNIDFIYLEKKVRPPIYHWCHHKARFRINCKNSKDPVILKQLEKEKIEKLVTKYKRKNRKRILSLLS